MAPDSTRRLKRIALYLVMTFLVGAAVCAALAWRYGGAYAQDTIREKLQEIVSGHLNARLEMGAITYKYPMGVVARDVTLISTSPGEAEIALASFKELRLQLGRSPLSDGPLLIERIEIDEPTAHVIRDADRIRGMRKLLRDSDDLSRRSAPKLSDVFHLRHLKLRSARVQYEDRREATAVPLVWENLNVEMDSEPTGGAVHKYQFRAQAGTAAEIASTGALDIDTGVLEVEKFSLNATAGTAESQSSLPPAVQALMKRFGISGEVELQVAGTIPTRALSDAVVTTSVDIRKGQAALPESGTRLEGLEVSVKATVDHSKISARTGVIACRFGDTGLSIQPTDLSYDLANGHWSVSLLRAAVAHRPPEPARNLLTQPMTLALVAQASQGGSGRCAQVQLDGTRLTFDGTGEILNFDGMLVYDASILQLMPSSATCFGGRVALAGRYDTTTRAASLELQTDGLQLAPIKALVDPQEPAPMAGRLVGEVKLAIQGGSIDSLSGIGAARITEGKFGSVPILTGISKIIGLGQALFIASEARAQFAVGDKKVQFDRVSVSTAAVKVVGRGDIGFDESLNLRLYVASAKNWGKDVKNTDIPLLSDVGGSLVGGVETVINGVSRQISSITATGTLKSPVIRPDPAPLLTDSIRSLFSAERE
ncbi:MAG: AsmA family protein [Burkholderiales bacterium]|nr:AsmA family protein [Phycisphaerae bacterium]